MNIVVKSFNQLSPYELYHLLKLRSDVFVVEQACIYPDLDNKDEDPAAYHILMYQKDILVGYARCLPPGMSFVNASSIGRVVIASSERGKEFARELMFKAIHVCFDVWTEVPIEIGAQTYLQAFYKGLGFTPTSSPYDEDGIMHIDMRLTRDAWFKS
ncbi:MAG: Uncharacterised protein [Glaciecola sp. HTCC2999]|nr:MAG: Uncharacterised protein [Glaciecola sp. HTCC2999]